MLSLRKIKIYFGDRSIREEHYLLPEDQLISDQGRWVMNFVYDLQNKRRPEDLSSGGEPLSVADIRDNCHGTSVRMR